MRIKKGINKVDKERKNKKKKEKKKNKKERKRTKGEILKEKDGIKIIDEIYELDEKEIILKENEILSKTIELNIIIEKKRKLKDILENIILYNQRTDKEKYIKLKKYQQEYEVKKRNLRMKIMLKKKEMDDNIFKNDPLNHMLPFIPLPEECKNNEEMNFNNDLFNLYGINILPNNIFPPGPPPTLPISGSIPIDNNILKKYSNIYNLSNNTLLYDYYYKYYFEDLLPPPSPPPLHPSLYTNSPTTNITIEHTQDNIDHHIYESENIIEKHNIQESTDEAPIVIKADAKLKDMQAEVTKLIPTSVLKKEKRKNKEDNNEIYDEFINEINKL